MSKLGIDLGSSSEGWYLFELFGRKKSGVITFDSGMKKGQKGNYESPTKDRQQNRAKRNLIQSRKYRKWELLTILIQYDLVPLSKEEFENWSKYQKGQPRLFPESENFQKWLACDFSYQGGIKYKNPYELRVKGLEEQLSKHEFGRVLYHLVQRRGYKDIGEKDEETNKQIKRRSEEGFDQALRDHRFISKALKMEFLDKGLRARNQYPYRKEYEDELISICERQGYNVSQENHKYVDKFIASIRKAIIWQQPLKTQKGNIGKCTFEPKKLRCPISHPLFEVFRAWQYINTIKYYDESNDLVSLNQDERAFLFDFFLTKDKNFKFEEIKKKLDQKLGFCAKYNYLSKEGKYDSSVAGMPICKHLVDVFGENLRKSLFELEYYNEENAPKIVNGKYSIYDLWHILFDNKMNKVGEEVFSLDKFSVENLGVISDEKKGNAFVKIRDNYLLQGYANLSVKAMRKILPFLKEGYLYNEAVVLAKIPELLGEIWEEKEEKIKLALQKSTQKYEFEKYCTQIVNNLIDRHKAEVKAVEEDRQEQTYGYKDYSYQLQQSDWDDVEKECTKYYGDNSWEKVKNKEEIIEKVRQEYQNYFSDGTRAYRKLKTFTDIFKGYLNDLQIELKGNPYHHSDRENLYNKNLILDRKTGERTLPTKKNAFGVDVEVLPIPFIDSIKNPMFNKAMSILRKLINQLILNGDIDRDTEIVIELARELNDDNQRIAIEKYQKERRNNREKIRTFLTQYKEENNSSINVEEKIPFFELWTEQLSEDNSDYDKKKYKTLAEAILAEKNDIERYELWMEQRGQCMYTGKMISVAQLFSDEVDIEHTIPRSILPDNTMANKTLAFKRYNRDIKKAKTPFYCENFSKDTKEGSSILPRLDKWKKLRDYYRREYEKNRKPIAGEDEEKKNKRIVNKHYYKMHLDYWRDKIERFEAEEVKDSWVRRQLTDTQMITKYAREYLKLYFKKVFVQKGSITADFRKLFGIQEKGEEKDRSNHVHHAIDALVLTLIPSNGTERERILKEYYDLEDKNDKKGIKELRKRVLGDINIHKMIKDIEDSTLVYNHTKDTILQQSKKKKRNRGKIQYVKDKNGKYILDEKGNKIEIIARGDTVRASLYKQTFLGKIRVVERDKDGKPLRGENGAWKYKTGDKEFVYVTRQPVDKVNIEKIVDPEIKKLMQKQKKSSVKKDHQGNVIRHIRVEVKSGRVVKERLNYRSKHEYKNQYYAEADSIPYAVMAYSKSERQLFPVTSSEIAKIFKKYDYFSDKLYLQEYYPQLMNEHSHLLKVGQRVFVLNDDSEFEKRKDKDFQKNRLYILNQFGDGAIYLGNHQNALSTADVKKSIALIKDIEMSKIEQEYGIEPVNEDVTIVDNEERRKDFQERKYRFDQINSSYRLSRLLDIMSEQQVQEIKKQLDKYKAIPSKIEIEGKTPLLKMSSKNWNFLYEGIDFEMTIDGKIHWLI